jgi:guanylate kinase
MLTAPSCAGKSYLLEALVSELGFDRIVSTTDRAPRQGEIEGVHYNFISTEQSKRLEAQGDLAELVTYNGTRYGVTHREMETKLASGRPPIVILEPKGIEIYRKYCGAKGWQLFSIYVETQESIRLERLVDRTTNELHAFATWAMQEVLDLASIDGSVTTFSLPTAPIAKIISANNKRLVAVLQEERLWSHANRWDVLADGTNLTEALDQIRDGVEWRNRRKEIYA